jgi:hypothetical protein
MLNGEDYRWVKLSVYPYWMTYSNEDRRFDIIHEFIHASNGYMSDYTKRLLASLVKDESVKDLLIAEWQIYCERATQDIATCIYSKMYNQLPSAHATKNHLVSGEEK